MFEPVIVIAGFPFPDITCTAVRILELKYALVSHKKQREKKPTTKGSNDVSCIVWARYCGCTSLFPS